MIVTLTGAYRNVGDHLIGERARALLAQFTDDEIINVTRTEITDETYDLFNRARAVILCGGPAYQSHIYPNIYPLDLSRITVPVVPMGLGYKSKIDVAANDFEFTDQSKDFIKTIHNTIPLSSVRDDLTLDVVKALGIENVSMTGCPVWYDLAYQDKAFHYSEQIDQVLVSMPARYHSSIPKVMKYLKSRYPEAEKIATFHHGFFPRFTLRGMKIGAEFLHMALWAWFYGFKNKDLSTDTEKLKIYDEKNSLHIGYRVHGHLYCLSHKQPSFLINEDSRGAGQALSTGLAGFDFDDPELIKKIDQTLDVYHNTKGAMIQNALKIMHNRFDDMKAFLASIGKTKA